jgi:hypothetical protein
MLVHVGLLDAMLGPYSCHVELMLSQERVPFKLLPGPKGTRRCRIMSGRCRGFHYQSWLSFPPSQVFILSIKMVIWGIWGYIFSDKAIFSHPSLDERSTIKAKQRSYVVQKCKIQATIIHYLLLSDIFARTLFFITVQESCSLFFLLFIWTKLASAS